MRKVTIILSLFAVFACGREIQGPSLGAVLHLDAATAGQVNSFDFYVYGPQFKSGTDNGKFLPCDMLLCGTVLPTDKSLDLLAKAVNVVSLSATGGTEAVSAIAEGDGRVVYVDAYDGLLTPILIANGCMTGVTVNSSTTTNIEIDVYPVATCQ